MPLQVDNPSFDSRQAESFANPRRITATATGNDAITALRLRGVLTEESLAAALRFERLVLVHEGGASLRGIDLDRTQVDYSRRPSDGFGDRELRAGESLRQARGLLGKRQFELLRVCCAYGASLGIYGDDRRSRGFVGDLLRVSLADLVGMWGRR